MLRAVGSVLTDAVREPVFVGRLGGEEFLVVLPETDLESARQAAERIREQVSAIDTRRWFGDHGLTVSLGVTRLASRRYRRHMLRRADIGALRSQAQRAQPGRHAGRVSIIGADCGH